MCAKDGKYLSASSFFGGNNQAKSNGVGSGAREQGVNVAGWGLWRAKASLRLTHVTLRAPQFCRKDAAYYYCSCFPRRETFI